MELRDQLAALPHDTLTDRARRALGSHEVEVDAWECRALHGGLGVASVGIYRVGGKARLADVPVPWSLVLKVISPPTPDKPTAQMELNERHLLYWRREALAYQSGLLDNLPPGLAVPRCYGVDERFDGAIWLWLEELGGESGRSWRPQQYAAAARDLGRLGGAYAAGQPLPDYPWLVVDQPSGWFERFARATAAVLRDEPWTHPLVQVAFPAPLVARVRRQITERDAILRALARLPRVLCHHDAWSRNLFASGHAGHKATVAVDWASVGFGALGAECGMLLPGSMLFGDLDPAAARRVEPTVFAAYVAGLREAGWRGDERLPRFGCTAVAAHLWGLPTWLPLIESEQGCAFIEQFWGKPIAETLGQWAATLSVVLDLGDEARTLLPTVS